jgi:hypothetical protein
VICTEKPQKSHQNQIPGARTWELRNVKQRVKLLATAVGAATFHCWIYKFLGKFLSYNFPKYYRLDSYKEVSLIFLHSLSEVLQMQMLSSSEWVPKRILKIAGLLVFCQLLAKKSIFIFNYLNISFMYVHSLRDRYFFSIHNATFTILNNTSFQTKTAYNGPSNKFIFRAAYGNSIVCNIFPA